MEEEEEERGSSSSGVASKEYGLISSFCLVCLSVCLGRVINPVPVELLKTTPASVACFKHFQGK